MRSIRRGNYIDEGRGLNHDRQSRAVTVAAWLVALAAAVYVVSIAHDTVVAPLLEVATPFVIAIVLALFLDPVVDRMEAKGLSRNAGVAVVGLSFVLILALAGFLVVPQIYAQASDLGANYNTLATQAEEQLNELLLSHKADLQRIHLPTTVREFAAQFSIQLESGAKAGLGIVTGALAAAFSRVLWVIIIPLATVWFLKDWDVITARIVSLTPEGKRERLRRVGGSVGHVFRGYVRGMTTVAILYSVVSCIWMSMAGLDFALVIGALSGLFYMIPYVGVLTTIVTVGIMALVQAPDSPLFAIAMMGGLVVQSFVIFDPLVVPRVVGRSVGVHPLLALFSLVVGAKLFGLPGMIVAMPVTASIQVAITHMYPELFNPKPYQDEPAEPYEQEEDPPVPRNSES